MDLEPSTVGPLGTSGEPTVLLNWHSIRFSVLTFSVQWTVLNAETHNWPKHRNQVTEGPSGTNGTCVSLPLHHGSGNTGKEWAEMFKGYRLGRTWQDWSTHDIMALWLPAQDLLKILPANIPDWRKKGSQAPTPSWEAIGNSRSLGKGESVFVMSILPGRWVTLQGTAPHSCVHGYYKVDSVTKLNEDEVGGGCIPQKLGGGTGVKTIKIHCMAVQNS